MIKYPSTKISRRLFRVDQDWGYDAVRVWLPSDPETLNQDPTYSGVHCRSLQNSKPTITGDNPCYHFQVHGTVSAKDPNLTMVPFSSYDYYDMSKDSVLERSAGGVSIDGAQNEYGYITDFGPGISDCAWSVRKEDLGSLAFLDYVYMKLEKIHSQLYVMYIILATETEDKTNPGHCEPDRECYLGVLTYAYYMYSDLSWGCYDPTYGWGLDVPPITGTELNNLDFSAFRSAMDQFEEEVLLENPEQDFSSLHPPDMDYREFFLSQLPGMTPEEAGALSRQLYAKLQSHLNKVQPYREWGELCQLAVDNLQYLDINSIAYLKEFKEVFGEIAAFKRVLTNPKSVTAWAGFYLSLQYGTRLTVSETFEIFNALISASKQVAKSKKAWKTCRSRDDLVITSPFLGQIDRKVNYKVYYRPVDSGLMAAYHKLSKWGLFPNLANSWDMVPFSFVVDWFVDVGGLLEAGDAVNMISSLDSLGALYTTKDTFSVAQPLQFGEWEIKISEGVRYSRQWSRKLHLPKPSLEVSSNYKNNIPQLLAILVQKIKVKK